MRGIPQVLYGYEYAMISSNKENPSDHSYLRMPLPQEGEINDEMVDMFEFQSQLFQWRKKEPVLHEGKTMHFLSRDNTYAFFRYNDEEAVFVFANASEEPREVPVGHYQEILKNYSPIGMDPLSGKQISLYRPFTVQGLSTVIVKLKKK